MMSVLVRVPYDPMATQNLEEFKLAFRTGRSPPRRMNSPPSLFSSFDNVEPVVLISFCS